MQIRIIVLAKLFFFSSFCCFASEEKLTVLFKNASTKLKLCIKEHPIETTGVIIIGSYIIYQGTSYSIIKTYNFFKHLYNNYQYKEIRKKISFIREMTTFLKNKSDKIIISLRKYDYSLQDNVRSCNTIHTALEDTNIILGNIIETTGASLLVSNQLTQTANATNNLSSTLALKTNESKNSITTYQETKNNSCTYQNNIINQYSNINISSLSFTNEIDNQSLEKSNDTAQKTTTNNETVLAIIKQNNKKKALDKLNQTIAGVKKNEK